MRWPQAWPKESKEGKELSRIMAQLFLDLFSIFRLLMPASKQVPEGWPKESKKGEPASQILGHSSIFDLFRFFRQLISDWPKESKESKESKEGEKIVAPGFF